MNTEQRTAAEKAKELVGEFVDKLTESQGEDYSNFFTYVLNQRTLLEVMSDMAMLASEPGDNSEQLTQMWDFISHASSTMSAQVANGFGLSFDKAHEAFEMANEMHKKVNDAMGIDSQ